MGSQANRRTRTPEENFSRMERELSNMRRKMDKLRNVVKDRAVENLDRLIQRTDSPFTIKMLNHSP